MGQKAFIYCRISQDREGSALGVQRQEEDCRKLAAERGLDVVEIFIDNDISAYSGKVRPGYRAMLDGLSKGRADVVLCWHTDRLHRSPSELEEYIKVCEPAGVDTYTVKAGHLDLATDAGRMIARLLGVTAHYESDVKSTRAKRKMEELARKGKFTGGYRPFGWDIVDGAPQLNLAEAAAVEQLHRDALDGRSLGSMVRWLHAEGFLSTLGNKFSPTTVRQILLRARNAGLAEYHGEIVGPSEFPAIISEDVHRAVVALVTDPKRGRFYSNKAKFLLVGIAQCHCGSKLIISYVTNRKGEKYPTYRCPVPGTGHVAKRANYVDEYVNLHAVAYRAATAGRKAVATFSTEAQALEIEAQAIRERLTEVALMGARGTITLNQLGVMNEDMQARLSAAEARLAELAIARNAPELPAVAFTDDVIAEDLAEWLALPIDDRRDFVRRVMNVVLLSHYKGSARVFDRDTVMVVYKTQSSARGLLPAAELASLRQHWQDLGILPASGLRTFNHPSPVDGRRKKVPQA